MLPGDASDDIRCHRHFWVWLSLGSHCRWSSADERPFQRRGNAAKTTNRIVDAVGSGQCFRQFSDAWKDLPISDVGRIGEAMSPVPNASDDQFAKSSQSDRNR